ncbi:replication-relaxation family protein [Micromonospora aurantiaca (nom. illeg.)]|uniref:replication-relaxation family protein n=1 Tax=Micromonospora aurantiaca (nom. illeg.) TaxID=47850 RepID=UPI0033CF648F
MTPTGTQAASSSRLTASVVAAELARLTPRDRLLLDLLDQHQTFSTEQVVTLAFGSVGRARNRLNTLHGRDILDRFRLFHRPGSQSWRWTLGPVGAAIVAAGRGDAMPRPAAVRDTTARLAMSPRLNHLLATNGFFVALTGHARTHIRSGTRLARWWNEQRCRDATGNLVRPDGHGVWVTGGRAVPFWLEMDLGTEALQRVADKLTGYAALGPRRAYPVLFWLPTAAREANLHALWSRTGIPDGVVVATGADDYAAANGGPGAVVWRCPGDPARVTLADVPATTGDGAAWDA